MMKARLLALSLVSGCFGAGDNIHIGHGTGEYKKWDTAKCTCDVVNDSYFGTTIQLGCTPMFTGRASTTLVMGFPAGANTNSRVNVADFFDASASGTATVEVSSELDDGRLAVWIDELVMVPHGCDGDGYYDYYSDICEPFEGGTLENVRMFCEFE